MDVDSTMTSESDQDPKNNGPSSEQLSDEPSAGESQEQSSPALQQQQSPPSTQSQQQHSISPVVGPRCAPTYSVVHPIMEKKEDGPGSRCGHTLTAVPAVGEEGTPGYIGPRLILFGGATALEGNSAATGTPSSAGSAGIRMPPYFFPFFNLKLGSPFFPLLAYACKT